MKKVIRRNKVAVVIPPNPGWNPELIFHPSIVDMIEQGRQHEITTDWISENLGIDNVHCEGAKDLKITWLDEGTTFTIDGTIVDCLIA